MHTAAEKISSRPAPRSAADRPKSSPRTGPGRIFVGPLQSAGARSSLPQAGVVQRAIRVGQPGAVTWYTEVDDVVAAARKGGLTDGELTIITPIIKQWVNDGLTHGYATWIDFLAAASAQVSTAGPTLSSSPAPASSSHSIDLADLSSTHDEAESPYGDSSAPDAAERLRAKLEREAHASASAGPARFAPVKVRDSTIRFSNDALAAASALNIDAESLQSRKPHTKRGTGGGGGGTDHSAADAAAAKRASRIVAEKIKKKTGANVKPKDYLKGLSDASAAAAARSEKNLERTQKAIESLQGAAEDRRDWIAYLAPKDWRETQSGLGNNLRPAPTKKQRIKELQALAKSNGWPATWDASYARDIYE